MTRQDVRKQLVLSTRENNGCNIRCTFDPVRAEVSYKPVLSKGESPLHPCGKKIFSSRSAKTSIPCQPPIFTSNGSSTKQIAQEGKLLFLCAGGSHELFDPHQPPRGEMPARENPEQNEKRRGGHSFRRRQRCRLMQHER